MRWRQIQAVINDHKCRQRGEAWAEYVVDTKFRVAASIRCGCGLSEYIGLDDRDVVMFLSLVGFKAAQRLDEDEQAEN